MSSREKEYLGEPFLEELGALGNVRTTGCWTPESEEGFLIDC